MLTAMSENNRGVSDECRELHNVVLARCDTRPRLSPLALEPKGATFGGGPQREKNIQVETKGKSLGGDVPTK